MTEPIAIPGEVRMLGHAADLKWSRTGRDLKVKLPEGKPCAHAWVLRIDAKG